MERLEHTGARIETLYIGNFKPISHEVDSESVPTTIPLGDLTLIYGPNSGGKSSILQAILLLRQIVEQGTSDTPLPLSGPYFAASSFRSIVRGHDVQRSLHLGFDYQVQYSDYNDEDEKEAEPGGFLSSGGARFTFLRRPEDRSTSPLAGLHEISVRMPNDVDWLSFKVDPGGRSATLVGTSAYKYFQLIVQQLREQPRADTGELVADLLPEHSQLVVGLSGVTLQGLRHVYLPDGRIWAASTFEWVNNSRSETQVGRIFQSLGWQAWQDITAESAAFGAALFEEQRAALGRTMHIGPVRDTRGWKPARIESFVGGVQADGRNINSLLVSGEVGDTDNWFTELDIDYRLRRLDFRHDGRGEVHGQGHDEVHDGYAVHMVEDMKSSLLLELSEVGTGVSQVLPVLAACKASPTIVNTVLVEQPELHLHPRVQANLGTLLAKAATNRQLVVETHSAELVLRIKGHIRRGTLPQSSAGQPMRICVLYADPTPDRAETVISQIRFDETGEFLDPWPAGFFPERLNELVGLGAGEELAQWDLPGS